MSDGINVGSKSAIRDAVDRKDDTQNKEKFMNQRLSNPNPLIVVVATWVIVMSTIVMMEHFGSKQIESKARENLTSFKEDIQEQFVTFKEVIVSNKASHSNSNKDLSELEDKIIKRVEESLNNFNKNIAVAINKNAEQIKSMEDFSKLGKTAIESAEKSRGLINKDIKAIRESTISMQEKFEQSVIRINERLDNLEKKPLVALQSEKPDVEKYRADENGDGRLLPKPEIEKPKNP